MAKVEWNEVKISDIQKNILTGGKEGTSAADALEARSEAYQAKKSHGAARFFKGLFSLGINEIWRFANYRGYESDKAKIIDCVKNVYKALEPKLGTTEMTVVFNPDGDDEDFKQNSKLTSTPNIGNSSRNVKLMEAKAIIERKPDGTGVVTLNDRRRTEIQITDCDQVRRNLEVAMARDARHFGKDFVIAIINRYKESARADARDSNEGHLHFGQGDDKRKILARRAVAGTKILTAKNDVERDAVEPRLQDQTAKSAARSHLKSMLAAFYSAHLDLPEEVGQTMDLEQGID